jgi:hypothetical protein
MAKNPVITRGDDLGSYRSALPAFQQGVEAGTLKNISVMSCGLCFEESVSWLRNLKGVDIGLHFCLSAEFASPKWGPISQGRTLRDESGWLTASPMELHKRGFDLDEAEAELRAQLARMIDSGIQVSYIDDHMGVSWLPGLEERIRRTAEEHKLLWDPGRPGINPGRPCDLAASALDLLTASGPEPKLFVTHPALISEEMESLIYEGASPGQVALERDEDRRMWTDLRLVEAARAGMWTPIRWTEAA